MPRPPPSTAWSAAVRCIDCDKPRPWFLMDTRWRCVPCNKAFLKEAAKRYRHKNIERVRERDRIYRRNIPLAKRRCYDATYKLYKRCPECIPAWVTLESLGGIYEYAERLNQEHPEYIHSVEHQIRIKGKDSCGLHVPANLQVVRRKR